MAENFPTDGRWLWIHRIGYVCSLLIVLEIVLIATVAGRAWLRDREWRADYLARSRVHSGGLSGNHAKFNAESLALAPLAAIAPVTSLGPNAVRLGGTPSLSRRSYAIAMRRRDTTSEGLVVIFDRRADYGIETKQEYHFRAPVADFDMLMAKFDAVTDGYAGSDRLCLDGVDYAFERRRGPKITSGTSMSSCDRTYDRAATLLTQFARQYVALPELNR